MRRDHATASRGLVKLHPLAEGAALFQNKRQELLDAAQRSPTDALALALLAAPLRGADAVTLRDGRRMDARALLVGAIKCDAKLAEPHSNLACALGVGEVVELADGRRLRPQELFAVAKSCRGGGGGQAVRPRRVNCLFPLELMAACS